MSKRNLILKIAPLILILLYVVATLIIFKYGLISWTIGNVNDVVVYLLLTYLIFSIGYIFAIKRTKKIEISDKEKKISLLYVRVIFWIGAIVGIVYMLSWIIFTFGNIFFDFLAHPGASYDYAEYLQKLYSSGAGIEYPMTFRWISRFNTLFGGFVLSVVPIGLFIFKDLKIYEKIMLFAYLAIYILRAFLFGAQSSFFSLALMIIVTIIAKMAQYIFNSRNMLTKDIFVYIFKRVGVIALLLICFLGIMVWFQNDRADQRVIRNNLYSLSKEYYGTVTSEHIEDNLLRSIEIDVGKELFDIDRIDQIVAEKEINDNGSTSGDNYTDDVIKEGGNSNTVEGSNSNTVNDDDIADEGRDIEKNFNVIDKYYKTKDIGWLKEKFPSFYYGFQSIEMYLTQGYAALGLAFEQDFEWTYFVGSSKVVTDFIDNTFGTDIFSKTYVYKNESINNWNSHTYFNSIYTWLASDFTFIGVIILFGLIGYFYGKLWLEILHNKSISIVVFYLLTFGLFMSPAVNILFQTLGSLISSVTILILYIFEKIMISKGGKIYDKIIR